MSICPKEMLLYILSYSSHLWAEFTDTATNEYLFFTKCLKWNEQEISALYEWEYRIHLLNKNVF